MQNIYGIIFIITSIVLVVWGDIPPAAAPKSLYDRLVKYSSLKCPYLKTTKLLDPKPAFLDACSNYDDIKSIKIFNYQTTTDVLCLLYYNNYISLCNVMGNTTYFNNTVIDNLLKGFALENTCKYLQNSKLIADLEDRGDIVTKMWDKCDFVCASEDGVLPICGLAVVSLNLTEWLQKYKSAIEAARNAQLKGSVHEKQTIPKGEDLDPQPDAAKDNNKETINVKQGKLLLNHAGEDSAHNIPSSVNKPLLNVSQEKQSKIDSHLLEQIPADGANSNVDKTMKNTGMSVAADTKTDEKPSGEEKPSGDEKSPTNDAEVSKSKTINNSIQPQTNAPASVPKTSENAEDQTSKPTTDVTKPNTSATAAQENKLEDENIDIDNNSREEMEPQPNDAQNIEEDSMEEEEEPSFREPQKIAEKIKQNAKPKETDEDAMLPAYNNSNSDEEDSFFFIYFMMVCAVFILGYVGYHNKQKVLALVIEGRRGRRGSRRGRPNSANYHKLDSNLEEAVTSACNKNTTNIIY